MRGREEDKGRDGVREGRECERWREMQREREVEGVRWSEREGERK